jgi:DNA (cytosine-5)-methyltransferase 1
MIHLDLFSGIGGFAYAVDQVWEAEHIFCEIDPYCQAVLKKHWKGSKIYGDIRELTADTDRNGLQEPGTELKADGNRQFSKVASDTESRKSREQAEQEGRQDISRGCFILTGGFPCQPFSQAGKRKGTSDNRYLWPAMFRVIQLAKPQWVIAENVRGLVNIQDGVVFGQVLTDLESEGYEVQPFIIPAVAVNAPHRRDRIWIIALHAASDGCGKGTAFADEKGYAEKSRKTGQLEGRLKRPYSNAPDTESQRSEQSRCSRSGRSGLQNDSWSRNWLEVATELCGVDDGLPAELDGLKLSKPRHRIARLKALGNAIVPQVAIEIMKAIKLGSTERNG